MRAGPITLLFIVLSPELSPGSGGRGSINSCLMNEPDGGGVGSSVSLTLLQEKCLYSNRSLSFYSFHPNPISTLLLASYFIIPDSLLHFVRFSSL